MAVEIARGADPLASGVLQALLAHHVGFLQAFDRMLLTHILAAKVRRERLQIGGCVRKPAHRDLMAVREEPFELLRDELVREYERHRVERLTGLLRCRECRLEHALADLLKAAALALFVAK